MRNRDWISKQNLYDFLCHLNEKDIKKCVVTLCSKKIDEDRCIQHNRCQHFSSDNECKLFSPICGKDYDEDRDEKKCMCVARCVLFVPDCEKCIADYLNEERGERK